MAINLSGFVKKITKIKLGTEDFEFTELSLIDLAEFKTHLTTQREKINKERRARLIDYAKEIAGTEGINPFDPMEVLKLIDTEVSEEELESQMETVEGIGFLAQHSLKHKHPGISDLQVMEIITPANIDVIVAAMFPSPDKRPDTSDKESKSKKKSRGRQP